MLLRSSLKKRRTETLSAGQCKQQCWMPYSKFVCKQLNSGLCGGLLHCLHLLLLQTHESSNQPIRSQQRSVILKYIFLLRDHAGFEGVTANMATLVCQLQIIEVAIAIELILSCMHVLLSLSATTATCCTPACLSTSGCSTLPAKDCKARDFLLLTRECFMRL